MNNNDKPPILLDEPIVSEREMKKMKRRYDEYLYVFGIRLGYGGVLVIWFTIVILTLLYSNH
jgi:hypothetical protein